MGFLIFIILIIIAIYFIRLTYKSEKNRLENERNEIINRYKNWGLNKLFTNEELKFYKKLTEYLKDKEVFLLSKVRIADFIKPIKKLNRSEFMKIFLKISQKHIDYVLTDINGKVLCTIELDGSSHLKGKTKENDEFKNDFFNVLEIPLIRFQNYNNHNLSQLDKYINKKVEI